MNEFSTQTPVYLDNRGRVFDPEIVLDVIEIIMWCLDAGDFETCEAAINVLYGLGFRFINKFPPPVLLTIETRPRSAARLPLFAMGAAASPE